MRRKWTNTTLRQKLGEAGFFETNLTPLADKADYVGTIWDRNGFQVVLWEHRVYGPQLTLRNTLADIDPDDLGVVNINSQERTRP